MQDVTFHCADHKLAVSALDGQERLGEASRFELELVSAASIDPASLVGQPCALRLVSSFDERVVYGIVWTASARATAQSVPGRRYRLEMRSAHALCELRRQTRVYQNMSVPDIVANVLERAGLGGERLETALRAEHAERRYVTQYAETDADFVRRLCEDEGLTFRFEARDGFDALVLEDTSVSAAPALDTPLMLVDESALTLGRPAAFGYGVRRRRRPGRVRLRDYDPEKPALALEAEHEAGTPVERGTEIYQGAAGFRTEAQGRERAQLWLESERALATVHRFRSNAARLAPGLAVELDVTDDYPGVAVPEPKLFVVGAIHSWRRGSNAEPPERVLELEAVALEVPFRLERKTPRPKLSGLSSAIVTGASGEEIHVDEAGRVSVRFVWDRFGPTDDKSSLPVRVMQSSLPGPMLIPRVGWEVMCAFEDGDPDRPYVLGRTYNSKWPPPYSLPENKTMTVLGTASSPGGAAENVVSFDDAAGRQHLRFAAGLGKTTTVGASMLVQTVGFEHLKVDAAQSVTIGGGDTLSVSDALRISVGSQTAGVSGNQDITINAEGATKTGSEAVAVGGALIELVGDPASGMGNFLQAAALAGVGQIPFVGGALAKGLGVGKALWGGYEKGGWDGVKAAVEQQSAGLLADAIPGGDALVAAADGAKLTPWTEEPKQLERKGKQQPGGGTGGPGGAGGGAAAAAPGHRKTIVDGAMVESIGAVHSVTTPGSIKSTSLGVATYAVGGGHSTRAVRVGQTVLGASTETAAAVSLSASGVIGRTVSGAMTTSISGGLTSQAGGKHDVKAGGPLNITVGGALDASGGSVVFQVGGSVLSVHGGGVLMKASTVTLNGPSKHSGKTSNG